MLSQRLYSFLGSWSTAYSSWVLVSMALERFLAVRFPLKVTLYNSCKARRVLTMLGVLGLVIALIYLPQLWTFQLVDDRILQCMYKPHYAVFMNTVYFWVSAAVYAFVPFCLLAILNCLIARQIRSSLQTRSAIRNTPLMPGHPHHGPSDHSVQRQVNLMLLSATVVFIVLAFPICIFMVAQAHWTVTQGYTRSNALKELLRQLAFVLVDSTHAVNFYLYFLSARRFRHHFLRLVTCRSCYCSVKSLCQHARGSNNSEVEIL